MWVPSMRFDNLKLGGLLLYRLADTILNPKWAAKILWRRAGKGKLPARTIPPAAGRSKRNTLCTGEKR